MADVDLALTHLVEAGATVFEEVSEVGGDIRMASVKDPQGFMFGIIENPHYAAAPIESEGPGR